MAENVTIEFETSTPVDYKRKKWFLNVKKIVSLFIKKPAFICLGRRPTPRSIILSNHEGTGSPLALELYGQLPARFWGAHEMNTSLKTAYQYLSCTFYHQKKHWNLFLARLFCLLAAPLARMFYIGLDLISTYQDMRFKNTLKESLAALERGHTLIIFPENSDGGYLKELVGFHQGTFMLLELCKKQGLDVPVYVAYYKRDQKQFIFDAPTSVNALLDLGMTRAELADHLCSRCNALGRMEFDP